MTGRSDRPAADPDPRAAGAGVVSSEPTAGTSVVTAPESLGRRAARGAAVTLAGQLTRIALQLVTVVVLSRLLSPSDYGLLAMAVVVVGVGEIFRDFGLSNATIQAKTLSRAQRDNLVWVSTGIGVALTVVVLAAAPLVASAFRQPALTGMLRVLSLTFLVNGIAGQFRADLNRRLRFGAVAACDIGAQAGSLAVAITSAALGAGYWALAAQQLTQVGLTAVLLVAAAGWLPGRPRREGDIRAILGLGGHLAATQLIYYVSSNLDTITVGVRFGSRALGIYNRGFALLMSPLNSLRAPATSVAVPVLSRLQDDLDTAGEYVRRAQLTLGYTLVAGLAVTAGAAHPVVDLVLGDKWAAVAPVLSYLAVAGACTTLAYVGLWVYLSRGLGKALLRYTMVTLALQAVCILGGSLWGVVGVAAGYAAAALLEWPLSLFWLSRRTVIPVRAMFTGAARVATCAVLAGVVARVATWAVAGQPPVVGVLTAYAAGAGTYGVIALAVPRVRADLMVVRAFAARMVRR